MALKYNSAMSQALSMGRQRGRIFLMIVIAVGALAAGLMISSTLFDRSLELRSARAWPEARPLPQFELTTAASRPPSTTPVR